MTDVFEKNELSNLRRKKTVMIVIYTMIAAAVVAADTLIMIFLKPVSYGGGLALNIVLTVIFAVFSLFYFDLPFRLVYKSEKFLSSLENGIRQTHQGVFLYVDEETTEESGVTFIGIVLEEKFYNEREGVHRLLLEHSHAVPDFHLGDMVSYTAQGNFLISYEVTERVPDELLTEQETARSIELQNKVESAKANKADSVVDIVAAAKSKATDETV